MSASEAPPSPRRRRASLEVTKAAFLVILVATSVGGLRSTSARAAGSPPNQPLQRLWSEYPLNQAPGAATGRQTTIAGSRGSAAQSGLDSSKRPGRLVLITLCAALGGLAMIALAVTGRAFARRFRLHEGPTAKLRGAEAARIPLKPYRAARIPEQPHMTHACPAAATVTSSSGLTSHFSTFQSEPGAVAELRPYRDVRPSGYRESTAHVSETLWPADEEAREILRQARQQAEELLAEARREAAELKHRAAEGSAVAAGGSGTRAAPTAGPWIAIRSRWRRAAPASLPPAMSATARPSASPARSEKERWSPHSSSSAWPSSASPSSSAPLTGSRG